jgi:type VI secretion system Hcp family effector
MPYRLYIKAKGPIQGPFAADLAADSEGRSRCYGFRFKGTLNNDPSRTRDAADISHEPILVLKPWGASSPQYLNAFWTKEVLDSVHLLFVAPDGHGKSEAPFQEIELTQVTVCSVEHLAGDSTVAADGFVLPEDAPAQLEKIGFRFEQMTLRNIPGKTGANYDWKHRG